MSVPITSFYAALAALILLVLSARVIARRMKTRISVGDGTDKELEKRMRVQANCVEYTPIAILLMLIAELQGSPAVALHVLGLMLVVGRVMHAVGFGRHPQILILRQLGMVLTLLMIGLSALALLAHALF